MKKEPRYVTEAALCTDFIAWVKEEAGQYHCGVKVPVWTAYAETAGWDILLVAEDGTQIGIEAKLRLNLKVLQQAIPDAWDSWHDRGPDFRAVLIPDWDSGAEQLCGALGLVLFGAAGRGQHRYFRPGLEMKDARAGFHYWSPRQREKLPEFVPDVPAGASAPLQLTKWKIAALRITATLEIRGHVTREDFRKHAIDSRRWTGPGGWLKTTDVPGRYVRGEALDFDRQHPNVYAQVLTEVRQKLAGELQPTPPAAAQPQEELL